MTDPWVDDIPDVISRETLMDLPIEIEVMYGKYPITLTGERAALVIKMTKEGETYQEAYDRLMRIISSIFH